ncbi:MAG: ATP-binding cassette domain-containing protein, partial [Firmicutes bacterium]|nr:ATP-binding cassette domain-containing protein [Bacillota bacterium]
ERKLVVEDEKSKKKRIDVLREVRRRVGIVFQNPDNQMVASIIEDDVAFGPENLGLPPSEINERVDWALECVGMREHRKGTPFRLSGGQKQRIAIAGVLALKPEVMILDESTAMLDPIGRREVMQVVEKLRKDTNMTVVWITHFMEEAALADRLVVMRHGKKVMEGTPRDIFTKAKWLEEYDLDLPLAVRVTNKLKGKGVEMREGILHEDELLSEIVK